MHQKLSLLLVFTTVSTQKAYQSLYKTGLTMMIDNFRHEDDDHILALDSNRLKI